MHYTIEHQNTYIGIIIEGYGASPGFHCNSSKMQLFHTNQPQHSLPSFEQGPTLACALKLICVVWYTLIATQVTAYRVYQSMWTDYVHPIINSLIHSKTCDVYPIIITEAKTSYLCSMIYTYIGWFFLNLQRIHINVCGYPMMYNNKNDKTLHVVLIVTNTICCCQGFYSLCSETHDIATLLFIVAFNFVSQQAMPYSLL